MEMVELLVIMEVQTKDALLQAINAEFVEAVELLLEHEELIYKPGEPYVSFEREKGQKEKVMKNKENEGKYKESFLFI